MRLEDRDKDHWRALRAVLPSAAAVVGVALSLWLWDSMQRQDLAADIRLASARGQSLARIVDGELQARRQTLERMAARWKDRGGTPRQEWVSDAQRYVDDHASSGFQLLTWLDEQGQALWVAPESARGASDLARALERVEPAMLAAIRGRDGARYARLMRVDDGDSLLPLLVALTAEGAPDGYLMAVFSMKGLLGNLLPEDLIGEFALVVSADGEPVFSFQRAAASDGALWQRYRVDLADDRHWLLEIAPAANGLGAWRTAHIILAAGLLLSLLMGTTIHFALRARGREVDAGRLVRLRTAELEAAERRYRDVVDASPSAMVMVGPDGRIALVNRALERLFGYSRDELLGEPVEVLMPDAMKGAHESYRQAYFNSPRPRMMGQGRDLYGRSKSGEEIPIEVGLTPIQMPDGVYVLSAVIDLTNRKRAERELAKKAAEVEATERRYRAVVDAAPSPLIMVDGTGAIKLINRAAETLFGYEQDELLGQPVELLTPAGTAKHHVNYREDYFAHPEPRAMGQGRDLYGRRKDGREIPIEVGLTPIDMPDGLHALSAVVDLTHRKQAERVLAEQAEELSRSNAELEQFAYVASHDLQEPLRMVRSYTELMEHRLGGDLEEKTRKFMAYVVEGAERMQLLINDLLLFSRVGRRELEMTDLDANRLVSHVVNLLSAALTDQPGAKVTWDELPTIRAAESMLVQLLQNLIGNGLKFHGDEPAHVHVSCAEREGQWCFAVQDNGIGIDPKYAERIFLVFQRLHERHRYPGTGIGLAVAKRIVERHGGKLWFESTPGEGATFFFTLPK